MNRFRRISIPGFRPEYALADNGGTLLVNGIPDPDWTADSMRFVRESARELADCRRVLESDPCRCFEIRMVDGMFLFTKSGDPESTVEKLSEAAGERVRCYSTGSKVYALPAGLCKGAAAARLAERIAPHRRTICARGQHDGRSAAGIATRRYSRRTCAAPELPRRKLSQRHGSASRNS